MDHRSDSGINCDRRLLARVPAGIRPSVVDMVRRVVGRFRPDRIVLFGSRARGDARADSDVDLLVVLPVDGSRRETRLAIRMLLGDLPVPIDVLVITPREWRMQRDIPGTVVWPARREGIVLYERRAPSASAPVNLGTRPIASLVSFDAGFDRTERDRKTPAEVLARFGPERAGPEEHPVT